MKFKRITCLILSLSIISSITISFAKTPGTDIKTYTINYDDEEQQTFKHWATHVDGVPNGKIKEYPAAYSNIMRDMNISLVRLRFSSTDIYGTDHTFRPEVVDQYIDNLLLPLADLGITKYLYTASNPLEILGGKDIPRENEEQHVEDGMRIIRYLAKRGAPLPYAISAWNEPDGERCPPERLARLTLLWRQKLDAEGFTDILMAAPDLNGLYRGRTYYGENDFEFFKANPEYAKACRVFCYHTYGHSQVTPEMIQTIRKGVKEYDMDIWSTETTSMYLGYDRYIQMGNGIHMLGSAMSQFQFICADVGWLGATAWFQFNAFSNYTAVYTDYGNVESNSRKSTHEMYGTGYGKDGANDFLPNTLGTMYRVLSSNVDSGAVVHRLYSDDPDITDEPVTGGRADVVAFTAPEKTTMIIINDTDDARYYNLENIPGKSCTQYYVDDKNWQSVQERKYNISDKKVSKMYASAHSLNVMVATNEDLSGPAVDCDVENSFRDGETYYVRDKNVVLNVRADEPAKVDLGFAKKRTDGDNAASFKLYVDKSKTVTPKMTDALGNKATGSKFSIVYDPNFVGLDLNTPSPLCLKPEITLTGITNVNGTVECGGVTEKVGDDFTFSITVPLEQGENELSVLVRDDKNNVSEVKKATVLCDSVLPEVTVDNLKKDVNQQKYLFKGKVSEPLESLTINGAAAYLSEDLTFGGVASLKPGDNEVKFTAKDKNGNVSETVHNVNFTADSKTFHKVDGNMMANRTDKPVVIDGVLDESDWNTNIVIDKVVEGVVSATASFGVMWDDENLYIAADVTDDKLCWNEKAPYENDALEVFLNPSNQKQGSTVTGEDKQVWAAMINGSTKQYQNKYTMKNFWKANEHGWSAEFAIPWSTVGLTPAPGLKIGFDIQVDENDGSGFIGKMVWQGADDNYRNTSKYGTVVLAAPGEEIVYNDVTDATEPDTPNIEPGSDTEYEILRNYVHTTFNGKELTGKNAPVIINYKPYVSTDMLCEVSGASGTMISKTTYQFTTADGTEINAVVGNNIVSVGDEIIILDEAPRIIDNAIYLDRSFLDKVGAKYLGFTYSYDDSFEERVRELMFTSN